MLGREQVIALAALRGPAALAEAELLEAGRSGATAMVIVPGEPPGKDGCEEIRRLASSGRVIVVASGGRLAPGNFERLLRLSVPDVESDVDVVDADGGLGGAIEAAEAGGFYRPGDALEVFCDASLVPKFRSELSDGSLSVDPTVVTVSPSRGVSDDPDGIIAAVHSGDEAAMQGVLDPHVFANDGVGAYRDVLFKEGLLREFLSDVAPSRELAIARLHDVLTAEVGDEEAGALQYLGSGRNGSAYRHPDGFIVKVTTDPREARSGERLVGADTAHLGRIYQVRPVADGIWMIIQEDLQRLPPDLREEFDRAVAVLEGLDALDALNEGRLLHVLEALRESSELPSVVDVLRRFGVVGMCRELRQLGLTADFHSGNLMLRGDRPVLIDLGTPGDDPGTLREFGSGAPGSGAAGPATMRGSNSGSWSNGRGALKAPRNHVPEDENETEGDRALDWGPGRITGASF